MKPLDGARLKIVWAEKHLDRLKSEIRAYLDSKPFAIESRREGRVIHVGATIITKEPPLDLGCIFGDCLNNLRSSLDYIAWELATKHTPPAVLGRQVSSIYFPLHTIAQDFAANGRTKLEKNFSFPTAVVDEIERVQPYHAGYESLDVLSKLVKIDKHRLPLLTVATEETNSIIVTEGDVALRLEFSDTPFDGPIATPVAPDSPEAVRAAEIFREVKDSASSEGVSGEQPADVNVDGEVTVFVSLKDLPMPNEPIDVTLSKIFKCVSDIIPRFEQFLA